MRNLLGVRTHKKPLCCLRMAEARGSSPLGFTPKNGGFAGQIYRLEETPVCELGPFTATVLQPEIKLVRAPDKVPQVARQYSLPRISIHRPKML
jgi:hypothetical protein